MWKGPGKFDFGSAKKPYLDNLAKEAESLGPRDYLSKKTPDLKLVDPKGKTIKSDSKDVLILGLDGTGSMKKSPFEFFDRSPLIYQTLVKYCPDIEICYSVIGDAKWDQWPAQVNDFGKGVGLDSHLKALLAEGGGGPGIRESYELWAHFMLNHVEIPKAESPTMIIIGDERFYEQIDPAQVKEVFGGELTQPLSSMKVWQQLAERYDIYHLHQKFTGGYEAEKKDGEIVDAWKEAIGEQRVIQIYDPMRIADQVMGIMAIKWGYSSDFKKNMNARQDDKEVESVMASLRAASISHSRESVKKSKKLAEATK